MSFFSTAANIEISGHPFPCVNPRPTRDEALEYYRGVASKEELNFLFYQEVHTIRGSVGEFVIGATDHELRCDRVVLATGFFHHPVPLKIVGEDLPHVSHYFEDGHRYFDQDLVIVGGANSAVIAALECFRRGARVTLIHREKDLYSGVKYWLEPDVRNRIAEGSISAHFNTTLAEIEKDHVVIENKGSDQKKLKADFVLLMTGYRANHSWLQSMGIELDHKNAPLVEASSLESTSLKGVHLVGCALCGEDTGSIFIENGREHAQILADHLSNLSA
jgi:thioredoxin reductase (NADPH)